MLKQTETELIREEQQALNKVLHRMDNALRELGQFYDQSKKKAENAKRQSLPDTYGALVHANLEASHAASLSSRLAKGKDELYTFRIIADVAEGGKTEEIEMPIGLHTYSHRDQIYIFSWVIPACRHFVIYNTATEYSGLVEDKNGKKYHTHYQLKLRREVEILFDKVQKVQHFFPLMEEEAEKIVYDAFLQELLLRRSEQEFRNIVFSIQKKQGEIIQAPFSRNLIVQGCAGSGKSMIMLHRLPIVLFDNAMMLSRTTVYIISPSSTYIEMSDNMRSELEIDDLKMGTLNQYYDYVIRKYNREPAKYGIMRSYIGLEKELTGFVYSKELPDYIQEQIRERAGMHLVDLMPVFQQIEIPEREISGGSPIQRMRSEVSILQEIIKTNEENLRKYTVAFREVIFDLERLQARLMNRKSNIINDIEKKISGEKESIEKYESELNKESDKRTVIYMQGRERMIRNSKDRIIFYQEKRREVEENDKYFLMLKSLEENISRLVRLYPHYMQNAGKANVSLEQRYRDLQSKKLLLKACHLLYGKIEKTDNPYIEYASDRKIVSDLYNAVEELDRINAPVLDLCLTQIIQKRNDYLQQLGKTICDDVYTSVMEKLGQKKNLRGTYNALPCSPYIYLQIIYHLEGAPNHSVESLIAIDEAQNITPEELRLLKSVNRDKTVFNLYGDIRQHVEQSKGVDSWKELSAIIPFTIYDMSENYRNARQITEFCNKKFKMRMRAINLDGSGVHQIPGDNPFQQIIAILKKPLKPGLSCIIVKSSEEAGMILQNVKGQEGKLHDITATPSSLYPNRWNLMTVNQVKGLEFETAVVFSGRMTENEKYIAFTRALDELFVYEKVIYHDQQKTILTNDTAKRVITDLKTSKTGIRKKRAKNTSARSDAGFNEKDSAEKAVSELSVKEFFERNGLEVIDARKATGFLWVLGTEDEIGMIVQKAVRLYGISGTFGSGKTSKYKPGWYTKTKK